ncbi:MAG: transglycosylase domain-containing protein [Clostridiaceae bacterium]|nr:transglycosylase domain-containing protein [Clostridiaceae bacterium]
MNYSEKAIKRKREELTASSYKLKYKIKEWLAYGGAIFGIALLLSLVFGISGAVRGIIDSTPDAEKIDVFSEGQASILYDCNGNEIQELSDENVDHEYVSFEDIPECLREAFVASEDSRFFEHKGVDFQGFLISVLNTLSGGEKQTEDGKTITQRLIENQMLIYANESSVLERIVQQIQEQYLAVDMEEQQGKEKILEEYLNTIHFGQNMIGVQAAADYYLKKDISKVTISEAAFLAAVAKNPTEYNPLTKQEENAKQRREILKGMLDLGYISDDEHEDALGDDIYLRVQNASGSSLNLEENINSYYVDAVIEEVISDMKEQLGYSQTQAYNAIYHAGLKIYTCQDTELQGVCEKIINSDRYYSGSTKSYLSYRLLVRYNGTEKEYTEIDIQNDYYDTTKENLSLYFSKLSDAQKYVDRFKKKQLKDGGEVVFESLELIRQPQASFVLLEQSTGQVKAIVGGRGQRISNSALNRATTLERQPGSCLGILSSYLPAIDSAGMTLGSVQDDADDLNLKSNLLSKKDTSEYQGLVTVRQAIVNDLDIPAVKLLQQVSVQTGQSYLSHLGLSGLSANSQSEEEKEQESTEVMLSLGEETTGVTNLDLTAAYAAVANQGHYVETRFYTKIVDRDGNYLLNNAEDSTQVMKESTAWLLTKAMQETVQEGDAGKAGFKEIEVAQAGVSSVTTDNTDYWFEGYTPYYTAGLWIGEDESAAQESSDAYQLIWRDIMEEVHKLTNHSDGTFEKPEGDDIVSCDICTKCGNLAVSGLCDEAEGGAAVRKEYFVKGTEPEKNCDCHVKFQICQSTGQLAGEGCPQEDISEVVLLQKTETAKTADTPYLIQNNLSGEVCTEHNDEE